jgi:hypothetical protein
MIGYSQLLKDILDLDKGSVEIQLENLARHKLTPLRMGALKQLARDGRGTVSGLLQKNGGNHTGGTYKTVIGFFGALLNDKILEVEKVGNRSYWEFSEGSKPLQDYFRLNP